MEKGALLFLLLINYSYAQLAFPVILPGGLTKFRGQVVAGTCTIDSGDRFLTVDMGRISSNRLLQVGEYADPIPFTLHFRNCNSETGHHLSLVFRGVADDQDKDLLAITQELNSARGVGIALFDSQGSIIPLNSVFIPISDGTSVGISGPLALKLIAKYRATSENISGGKVDAQAWFLITYQ